MRRYERVVHVGTIIEKQILIIDGESCSKTTYHLLPDSVRWEHQGTRRISSQEADALLTNRHSKGYRLVLDIPINEEV